MVVNKNEIYEFVKDKKGNRVGVILGYGTSVDRDVFNVSDPQPVPLSVYTITTCRCSPTDTFSEDRAIAIARGRAVAKFEKGSILDAPALSIIKSKQYEKFASRCKRYFKDAFLTD